MPGRSRWRALDGVPSVSTQRPLTLAARPVRQVAVRLGRLELVRWELAPRPRERREMARLEPLDLEPVRV